MARRAKRHPLHVLRVVVQLAFLALFLALVVLAARGALATAHPWLAQLFLITDPLVLVGTALAGGFTAALLAALVVVAISLLAPRAYCGWVCPLGTTMDIADKVLFRKRDRSKNLAPRLRQAKYGLLAVLLVLAAFRLGVFGWFDPICIATRSYGVAIWPMADHAARTGLVAAEEAGVGPAAGVYDWARQHHLLVQDSDFKEGGYGAGYRWAWVFTAVLAAIVLAQAYQKRFWCRNLCPLGAMLGLIGSASPLRPRVSGACIACGRCRERCKTGAFQPAPSAVEGRALSAVEGPGAGEKYRGVVQECILCYACEREFCPVEAIHAGTGSPRPVRPAPGAMPSRRAFLGAAATGAVLGPAFLLDQRTRDKEETNPHLRPPGAARPDAAFQAACIRCGECMRVCPTNALHPSGIENGIAGLWTPTFVFNAGYCDFQCAAKAGPGGQGRPGGPGEEGVAPGRPALSAVEGPANLCGIVCPTGAIAKLTHADKTKWKIGTAEFDKNRCLPWARSEQCLTCEEQCPLPEKAISHTTTEVPNPAWLEMSQAARNRYEELEARRRAGGALADEDAEELQAMPPKTRLLALPFTLRDRCIGCGICENVCPVEGPSGIRVQRVQTQEVRDDDAGGRGGPRYRGGREDAPGGQGQGGGGGGEGGGGGQGGQRRRGGRAPEAEP